MLRETFKKDKNYLTSATNFVAANVEKNRSTLLDNNAKPIAYYSQANGIHIYIKRAYSLGIPVKELIHSSKDMLNNYLKSIDIDEDYSDGGDIPYSELLSIISLGILSDANEELRQLSNTLRKVQYKDYLVDFLLNYAEKNHTISKTLLWPDDEACKKLKEITISGKNEAETDMKLYLEKYFYTRENFEDEYDSHKRNDNVYDGYWSFESAAITKVMGLDDSSYINSPYYPKDMLHGDPPGYVFTPLPQDDLPPKSPGPEPQPAKKKWWKF